MRVVTWNLNGLRSPNRASELAAVLAGKPDVVCLQETKIGRGGVSAAMPLTGGYHRYFNNSVVPGRAGVATLSREQPLSINDKVFGEEGLDGQGRALVTEYATLSVVNVYMPHGGRAGDGIPIKLMAFDLLLKFLTMQDGKPLLVVGDLNVAHADIDLARPQENRGRTMFTAEERARLDMLVDLGYVDAFRYLHPETPGYTWWPYAYNARRRNIGWRLDYAFLSELLVDRLAGIKAIALDAGSDHCALAISLASSHRVSPARTSVG